ncbi:MAG: DUF4190 domain-containing protein [Bacteroidales bacterium]|nr:DUF4190 domain-containing protein [Bacteroidales bacterium]
MEEVKSNSGQALGIAALITGIISFILASIPCVGIIAIVPAIMAVVMAAIGLSQASRDSSPRGLNIAGLIIGILAFLLSFSQIFVGGKLVKHADKFPVEIRDAIKDIKRDVLKDLEDANVNIRVESNGEVVEIKASKSGSDEKVKQLEDLEEGETGKADTVPAK